MKSLKKTQLQWFLGSLNYVADFYQNLCKKCKPLFDRLQTNPPPWTHIHTSLVKEIKQYVQTLPCLSIPTINSFKIVETNASNIGYGGIFKQKVHSNQPEKIVCFHSRVWNFA
jgi:phospholipid N-methyltransferase